MKLGFGSLLLSMAVMLSASAIVPARAQALQPGKVAQALQPYQVAQADLDIFIDNRGRRFLVDPASGEIIGRANRNARFNRRDKIRAERAYRRRLRSRRFQKRLGNLFGAFDDREERARPRRLRKRRNALRRDFGRQDLGRQDLGRQGKRRYKKIPAQPLPKVYREEEIARLPDSSQPVQNSFSFGRMRKPKYSSAQMTSLQVFLDRAGFSPGVIDGRWGSNVVKAVASWKEATGSNANLGNAKTLAGLVSQSGGDVFYKYTITAADVAGPYLKKVPSDYAEKSQLEKLGYTSIYEMLSEKFHMSQRYLRKLNKGKNFHRSGTQITVVAPGVKITQKVHYIVADKKRKQVRAYSRNGKLITAYPATIGSAATPSPSGTHSVERIAVNPEYTYNPKKNFQQGDNDKILRIPPGPNGPVGTVWIALSKPTYGIHGTPNPDTIGKTSSHGCIRLTNWDARELAKIVRKGVTVEFVE